MKPEENKEPEKKAEKSFFDFLGDGMHRQNASRPLEKFKEEYFQFGEYELKKYQEFVKEQLATGKIKYGECGANFSITFIPTGIGVDIIARCYDTDASACLVDYENW
jgi:hypothetical protein